MVNLLYLCKCGQQVSDVGAHDCPGQQVAFWDCPRCGPSRCESWKEMRALQCHACGVDLDWLLEQDMGTSVHVIKCGGGCNQQVDDPDWKVNVWYGYESGEKSA